VFLWCSHRDDGSAAGFNVESFPELQFYETDSSSCSMLIRTCCLSTQVFVAELSHIEVLCVRLGTLS
jgi:hypothetical protein